MYLGESTIDMTSVKIRRVNAIGVQLARWFETQVDQTLTLSLKVGDEIRAMVIALLSDRIHVTVNRWSVIMLLNELNHRVT